MEAQVRRGPLFLSLATLVCVGFAVEWWILVGQLDAPWLPIGFTRRRWTIWACAMLAGTIYAWRTGRARRGLGLAFVTIPLWGAVWSFVSSIPRLTSRSSTLEPLSEYQLSNAIINGTLYDIGFLGVGALLWFGLPQHLPDFAKRLSTLPGFNKPEGRSFHAGWLIFPPLLYVTVVINNLLYATPALANGNEASIWDNMTPYHTILLSATAAFTEELGYRIVGTAVFAWIAARLGAGARTSLGIAIMVQALVFGGAHGFYGTWAHVILPTLFGLVAGGLLLWQGIWAPVLVHFLFDLYAFGVYTQERFPDFYGALNVLLWINILWTLTWSLVWVWRRFVRPKLGVLDPPVLAE